MALVAFGGQDFCPLPLKLQPEFWNRVHRSVAKLLGPSRVHLSAQMGRLEQTGDGEADEEVLVRRGWSGGNGHGDAWIGCRYASEGATRTGDPDLRLDRFLHRRQRRMGPEPQLRGFHHGCRNSRERLR